LKYANPGWAVAAHIPALKALSDYELRAVSTNRPDSEETAAQAFRISASFDKYRELLRHPGVDLVVVAVNGTLVSNAHHNQ
jgi:predicted dehydrogenase